MNHEATDPGDQDPLALEMLVSWLNLQNSPIKYEPLHYSDEPWRSHAANAWILGDRLQAAEFKSYALSQFVTNCALAERSSWELIEAHTHEKSPIRRFSNHWIAWNHSLVAVVDSEYNGLKATNMASVINDDTCDPRIYNLEHWYSSCGDDINSTCSHNPVASQVSGNTKGPARKSSPDWGHEWESKYKSSKPKTVPRGS